MTLNSFKHSRLVLVNKKIKGAHFLLINFKMKFRVILLQHMLPLLFLLKQTNTDGALRQTAIARAARCRAIRQSR